MAGLAFGIVGYHAALSMSGYSLVDIVELQALQDQLHTLREENQELSDELFTFVPGETLRLPPEDLVRPYDPDADARADVATARARARNENRFLMVTFGANWCQDCRTLYAHLGSDEVAEYVSDRFEFVNVNVGKFKSNINLAAELGIDLEYGIPVAIFYDRNGDVIGTTNEGELEPARLYTSKQILKFVRDVAERSRILAPDAVR